MAQVAVQDMNDGVNATTHGTGGTSAVAKVCPLIYVLVLHLG